MGYEQNIPPVPAREQEEAMIEKFQQSWLNQPWNRFYMNENLRIPKMKRQYRRQYVRKQFALNLVFYSLLFAPLLYLSKRFFIYRKDLPLYMDFKYNDVVIKAHNARKRKFAYIALPSYAVGVYLAAKLSTDRSPVIDYALAEAKDERWL